MSWASPKSSGQIALQMPGWGPEDVVAVKAACWAVTFVRPSPGGGFQWQLTLSGDQPLVVSRVLARRTNRPLFFREMARKPRQVARKSRPATAPVRRKGRTNERHIRNAVVTYLKSPSGRERRARLKDFATDGILLPPAVHVTCMAANHRVLLHQTLTPGAPK